MLPFHFEILGSADGLCHSDGVWRNYAVNDEDRVHVKSQPLTAHRLNPIERWLVHHDMGVYAQREPRVFGAMLRAWGSETAWLMVCACVWGLVAGILFLLGALPYVLGGSSDLSRVASSVAWGVAAAGLSLGGLRFVQGWRSRDRATTAGTGQA